MLDEVALSYIMFGMNRLPTKQRTQILRTLLEGSSIRAAARIADVSRNTVDKLLREAGEACLDYQDKTLRNLPCRRIQCDEIWSFVCAKQKNVQGTAVVPEQSCNVWTWTAIDADTKLIPCWHVGGRNLESATTFIDALVARLSNRVQLTTDGYRPYVQAIENARGDDIDYAPLFEIYGTDKQAMEDKRRSPASFGEAKCGIVSGDIVQGHISTSYVGSQNLAMPMSRFTRLTNGFGKKVESHMHAISLHYMHYNFCLIHKSLKVTPAMEAGIAESVYDLDFIVKLIDECDAPAKKSGPYKKRHI